VTVLVRDLEAGDRAGWERLWVAYLDFYGRRLPAETTEITWQRLVGRQRGMGGLVADDDEHGVIGFAHHVVHPSTWATGEVCYLEDLMVDPDRRRRGAGEQLIRVLVERARSWGCESVYWHTEETNETARRLYDRLASLTGYRHYEIEL
jgi:GNAT superfamily N-acetyltransferase